MYVYPLLVNKVYNPRKMSRIIFCVDKGRMVLLHGFIKKSRKTPKKDIDLAVRRKRGEGL